MPTRPMAWARGVVAVHRALHLDHHPACVGQQGKVVHARNGAGQLRQHGPGGSQQRGVLIGGALHGTGAEHVEGRLLRGPVPVGQATLPRAHDPGLDGQWRGLWLKAEQRAARLCDQVLALGWRWRCNGKHGTPEVAGAGRPACAAASRMR